MPKKMRRRSAQPSGGERQLHQRVKTASGKTPSSQRWLERQLNDPYVLAAKRKGYRSRAAFKLAEIDDKYHFLKPGLTVIDLGAAPGGWSQIAAERTQSLAGKGQVIAVDYLDIEPAAGVEAVKRDFLEPGAEDHIAERLRCGRADIVLSDMAAPTVGHARTDHLRIMGLAEAAAEFAARVLRPKGVFLCKVLQGGTERDLLIMLKRNYADVRHVKPPASRTGSAELYVLARGFRAPDGA